MIPPQPYLDELVFFGILANISRAMPQVKVKGSFASCLRINTFAAIHSEEMLNADNLFKDERYIGKNHFFSRYWEKNGSRPSDIHYCYPMLALSEGSGTETIKDGNVKSCTQFQLMMCDQMPHKKHDCKYCQERTYEEVGRDIKKLMRRVFKELMSYNWTRVMIDGQWTPYQWLPSSYVDKCLGNGDISNQESCGKLSSYIREKELKGEIFYDQMDDNLAMYIVTITVCFDDCEIHEMNYKKMTPQKLKDGKGCC